MKLIQKIKHLIFFSMLTFLLAQEAFAEVPTWPGGKLYIAFGSGFPTEWAEPNTVVKQEIVQADRMDISFADKYINFIDFDETVTLSTSNPIKSLGMHYNDNGLSLNVVEVEEAGTYDMVVNYDGESWSFSAQAHKDKTVTAQPDPNAAEVYYATFYDSTTSYVADCEVYYVSANTDGRFTLLKADDNIIKAGEGVILKADKETISLSSTITSKTYTSLLTGSDTATTVTNALVLSYGTDGVRFYNYSGTVEANKAYLAQ